MKELFKAPRCEECKEIINKLTECELCKKTICVECACSYGDETLCENCMWATWSTEPPKRKPCKSCGKINNLHPIASRCYNCMWGKKND